MRSKWQKFKILQTINYAADRQERSFPARWTIAKATAGGPARCAIAKVTAGGEFRTSRAEERCASV